MALDSNLLNYSEGGSPPPCQRLTSATLGTLGRWCSPLSLRTDYLEAIVTILGVYWGSGGYLPYSGLKDLELPQLVLVYKIRLFLYLKSLQALLVLYRVGSTIVNTLLRSIEFRAISLSLGVRSSCIVATLGCVLTIPANIAKLVVLEVLADLKVYRVRLIVEDLGLLDQAAFIQSSRYIYTIQVKDNGSKLYSRGSRQFNLDFKDFRDLYLKV